jgi:hypothetical protein
MSKKRKRKKITLKIKSEVRKRDNFTCKTCGRSIVTHPGLELQVDHIIPFSHGGPDEISNYQTLCMECNLGKGNNEHLNRTLKNDLDAWLDRINPQIRMELSQREKVSVVANQEDYVELTKKNSFGKYYQIEPSTNTIMGFQALKNLGIYTLHDNHGSKVHFHISKSPPATNP